MIFLGDVLKTNRSSVVKSTPNLAASYCSFRISDSPHWLFRQICFLIGIAVAVLLGCGVIATAADEKSNNNPTPVTDPMQGLEELGFSEVPKEGDKARTAFFGVVAEGYKFVYVLDRSGSMGGSGRIALKAVKAELEKSLEKLDTIHQFQIIFYNERPVIFNPTGISGRLAFATEQNVQRAVRFMDTIAADGGTDHEEALKLAVSLRPDAIFFLTDADEPFLSDRQLEKIADLAGGITIHTIEFGVGPRQDDNNFLVKLAKQNRGRHVYIDLSKPTAQTSH
jgi:hypothetical protein